MASFDPAPAALQLMEHLADAVYLLDPATSNVLWGNRAAWESLLPNNIVGAYHVFEAARRAGWLRQPSEPKSLGSRSQSARSKLLLPALPC